MNKHTFYSPIKPPRTYRHDDHDDEFVCSFACFSRSHHFPRHVQNESPLVYSLTDYRLRQKRPDYLDLPANSTSHRPHSTVISSTTLNSIASVCTDDNAPDNKRSNSKWLIIDEINVGQHPREPLLYLKISLCSVYRICQDEKRPP